MVDKNFELIIMKDRLVEGDIILHIEVPAIFVIGYLFSKSTCICRESGSSQAEQGFVFIVQCDP